MGLDIGAGVADYGVEATSSAKSTAQVILEQDEQGVENDPEHSQPLSSSIQEPMAANNPVSQVKLFAIRMSVAEEIAMLQDLRESDPDYATQIMLLGESLINMAGQGALDTLVSTVLQCREGELLAWTCVGMFKAACRSGHAQVVKFMADNGMDSRHPGLRHLLHELVQGIEESEKAKTACDSNGAIEAENHLLQVFPLLIKKYGFDVNSMRATDAYTPLHLACRAGRVKIFKLLILLGADVQAVANDDTLPLTQAENAGRAAVNAKQVIDAGDIVKYLKQLGATSTIQYINTTG